MRDAEQSTEATLRASRALLGVVARSVSAALHEITLPQFRVLVILAGEGPLRSGAIAQRMGSHPSTFSRTVDRLVAGGWVARTPSATSGRERIIGLTAAGASLVAEVTERRRREIAEILVRLAPADRARVEEALQLFADAAGEPSARDLLTLGL
ncbi:MarR family transcriptional regulator [Cnuibacter physcomitrellae]|uniref:MarR family winged helix-turn-helix transcriptional regulator n=1 Tax=Cnuibacter physcomitrellae TaxID=1619308 RepID=UPI002175E90B|nr:MarR family transcriptional regulator [Cnuibacter physcomitrellae]MCS5497831.1 MarR family transcriptional regulator [Cnuibacter physcomitrellae]